MGSVIHLITEKSEEDKYSSQSLLEQSMMYLKNLNETAINHDTIFYLENIYKPVSFYTQLFNRIKAEGYTKLGFCFDIGHAKVWSGNTISAWMELLKEFRRMEIELHFHIHMNYGQNDDHLSFLEFQRLKGDKFSEFRDYRDILAEIDQEFPQATKIFEVKPEYAIMNIEYCNAVLNTELQSLMQA